jgi:hypothetical protein
MRQKTDVSLRDGADCLNRTSIPLLQETELSSSAPDVFLAYVGAVNFDADLVGADV